MTNLLDFLLELTTAVSNWLWGAPMVALLLGTGLVLTVATRGVQVRHFFWSVKAVLGRDGHAAAGSTEGNISSFQALMTELSGTVGNGNIAGVATAIAAGGPGAAFWMWMTALVGMATKYSEAMLAVKFRVRMPDGTVAGGPMYYCRNGISNRRLGAVLGTVFAVSGGLATLLGTGNMFQTQSMALAANHQWGVPMWVSGSVVAFFAGLVIIGGIRRIGLVAEKLVPGMILFYFAGAALVLFSNLSAIPEAFRLIIVSAFDPQAALGGAVGIGVQQAVRFGVARGILSNESGLGSAPIAHGAARTKDPVRQGTIAMMGTFIDTIIVCTLTALTIVVSGVWTQSALMVPGGLSGADLTVSAFNTGMPSVFAGWGGTIVVCSSLIFGFTTLIGWSYYGEVCFGYLFGIKIVRPYRLVYILLLFTGSLLAGKYAPIVTNVGDTFNAVMAFPNLIALLLLTGVVAQATRAGRKPEAGPGERESGVRSQEAGDGSPGAAS